jgi:hypothetical protein
MKASPALQRAVQSLAALETDMWENVGPALTCRETNALCALLNACGLTEHADALLDYHAAADEEEDEHWTGDTAALTA